MSIKFAHCGEESCSFGRALAELREYGFEGECQDPECRVFHAETTLANGRIVMRVLVPIDDQCRILGGASPLFTFLAVEVSGQKSILDVRTALEYDGVYEAFLACRGSREILDLLVIAALEFDRHLSN